MSQQAPDGQGSGDEQPESEPQPEITWVGQQWRMDGYCGRAMTPPPAPPATQTSPPPAAEGRPVAVVRTRRPGEKVVRIGPPKELPAA